MKKLSFFVLVMALSMPCLVVNAQNKTVVSAAQAILNDIAAKKINQFNWLYLEEAKKLNNIAGKDEEFLKYVAELEKRLPQQLRELHEYGIKGQKINWNDVKVLDVEINTGKSKDVPEIGGGVYDGTIILKSSGKIIRWRFKIGYVINGEWRLLLPRVRTDVNGEYIADN